MLNILVTGGAGFIGSGVCRKLLSQGNRVVNLDNFNTFYNPDIKKKNVENELLNPNYTLYEADILDKPFLEDVFKKEKIDVIIHLAAMAGVRPSIENPEKYVNVNIQGTLNILELAKENNIKKIIFASSSSVYGDHEDVSSFSEDETVINKMISPYAITKKCGEDFCYFFHKQYGLDIVLLRFFTVYGPGQRPDLAIHKFVKLISEDKEIPMFGTGETLRDYTYIDDIVLGVTASVDYILKSSEVFEIINLSGNEAVSLKNMISEIETATNKKAKIKQLPMQAGDVFFTQADLTKARKLLNYNPTTQFREGIGRFNEWFKRNFGK